MLDVPIKEAEKSKGPFFGSEFITSFMSEHNINTFWGGEKVPLFQIISIICTYILSINGRDFFPVMFNRNKAIALQLTKDKLLAVAIRKFEDFTLDDQLRKYFIYMSFCITRGHIDIKNLQRSSSENIPNFEEWYQNISNGPYANAEGEKILLDDLERLVRGAAGGRISQSKTPGALDISFEE